MNKRDIILDAMQDLFTEGHGGTASVSDIAKKAGIAKGGLYYYFRSKEEVLDALVERQYADLIKTCSALVDSCEGTATQKLATLFKGYYSSSANAPLDQHLHMPQNAAIHQKSLAMILNSLSPIVSKIIEQGVKEGTFVCDFPQENAEIMLSVFAFLLDPGIFYWTTQHRLQILKSIADLMEKGLSAKKGSFAFFYKQT